MFSYLKNDLSKFFAIGELTTTLFIFDLDPSNGNMNDVRELSFPSLTFTSLQMDAGGAISDNILVCSILTSSTEYHIINIINTDTWTVSSYNAPSGSITLLGFSLLFSTDQIVLSYEGPSSEYFTIRIAYDKLNLTELYTS